MSTISKSRDRKQLIGCLDLEGRQAEKPGWKWGVTANEYGVFLK